MPTDAAPSLAAMLHDAATETTARRELRGQVKRVLWPLIIAVAAAAVPGIMNRPKTTWQQAVAAVGLMVFLLTIPAQIGVHTRSKIGFVLQAATPLNLTPTFEAQTVTRLAAGQPARVERQRGNYLLIRAGTQGFRGWVEQNRFALICSRI